MLRTLLIVSILLLLEPLLHWLRLGWLIIAIPVWIGGICIRAPLCALSFFLFLLIRSCLLLWLTLITISILTWYSFLTWRWSRFGYLWLRHWLWLLSLNLLWNWILLLRALLLSLKSMWKWLFNLYWCIVCGFFHVSHLLHIGVHFLCAWIWFQSLSIPESIQSVVSWWRSRVYTCNHHDLWTIGVQERVSQNHSQLGCTEGDVSTIRFERSDAFLECKQTFVDFSSFKSSLPIVTLCVLCSLWSC